MIVEILGAKMLAPYFGTSHFVWTAQIGVTLLALASGYYFGGWLADRSARPARLYCCIGLAAAYLGVTVVSCQPVAYACLQMNLALGSIATSLALFFIPLTLLATTGPFLARLLTSSVEKVGGQVGRLTAISTLGSVVGTGLIGYALLPLLPNSYTMAATAALLAAMVAAYFAAFGKKAPAKVAILVLMSAGLVVGGLGLFHRSDESDARLEELYSGNSHFGRLQVMRDVGSGRLRYLNDFLIQNTYDPARKQSTSMFTFMLHELAGAYRQSISNVLCIGLGMGIVPMQFARDGAQVDVVEINPSVVPLAVRYFDLEPARLHIVFGDGRYFLNATKRQYDALILDAFLGDSSPSHLMTREAFAAMRRVLRPGGVLVINSFGAFEPGRDFFSASLERTLQAVFKRVRIHAAGSGNTFYVASDNPDLAPLREPDLQQIHPMCQRGVRDAFESVMSFPPDRGRVLTDDFNPVEFYDAANREWLRRQLALDMRAF